jgi:hypothetical protein
MSGRLAAWKTLDGVDVPAHPRFVPYVVGSGVLKDDPFVLFDVGCGLGIDSAWRLFEPHFHAHGFDPQVDEVARLTGEERNPDVHYHVALVGLPDDHEFHLRRRSETYSPYFDPITRSSAYAAAAQEIDAGGRSLSEFNSWQEEPLTTGRVSLTDFARGWGLEGLDFVKTDTDGGDYEVLLSALELVSETGILGFMVETPFNAAPGATTHAFHNVDLLLRRQGFLLYGFNVCRYSRDALPAPFVNRVLGETTFGQAMWGDAIYLRDAGSPDYADVWGDELSATKLLKLACLYELFRAPDCAAELLLRHEATVAPVIDVNRGLDLLTPRLRGRRVSYRDYVAAFRADPRSFYRPRIDLLAIASQSSVADTTELRRIARAVDRRIRGRVRHLRES